jgi:hypothetical protein
VSILPGRIATPLYAAYENGTIVKILSEEEYLALVAAQPSRQ